MDREDNYKNNHNDYDLQSLDYMTEEDFKELPEYYLDELFYDLTYEAVSENYLFIKNYVKENGLPIAENMTFIHLFEFLFESN